MSNLATFVYVYPESKGSWKCVAFSASVYIHNAQTKITLNRPMVKSENKGRWMQPMVTS